MKPKTLKKPVSKRIADAANAKHFPAKSWYHKWNKGPHEMFLWNETYLIGFYVVWPCNDENYREVLKRFECLNEKQDAEGLGGAQAKFVGEFKKGLNFIFIRNAPDPKNRAGFLNYLTHECSHAVNHNLNWKGMPWTQECDEAHAYLHGWLLSNIYAKVYGLKI